ncbi:hypothetical protein A0J48_006925 [Sphaerospermopsis aphanizomenoides BCCUSP55]|uniref:hypothetical protein n=1 Tax=Sphaerospermopsis aphanizomenoides TaxID=459663 RepID=UPI001907CE70|nr:hypothetical protein [Sphaerospermopsis aphanizomenoides]MBK1987269.1 hypothetical protein [Sphaerospermopsis aphanizomenoides BCCUSP55]
MTNRPTPDPSWDYALVWHELCELETKLKETLEVLQKQEKSSHQSNAFLLVRLGILDGKLEKIFDLVNPQ